MMLTGSTIMVNAENSAKIEYRFEDARAGYAQGTVTFTASADGEFDLYWADDTAALTRANGAAIALASASRSPLRRQS